MLSVTVTAWIARMPSEDAGHGACFDLKYAAQGPLAGWEVRRGANESDARVKAER